MRQNAASQMDPDLQFSEKLYPVFISRQENNPACGGEIINCNNLHCRQTRRGSEMGYEAPSRGLKLRSGNVALWVVNSSQTSELFCELFTSRGVWLKVGLGFKVGVEVEVGRGLQVGVGV